jgi:2-hydroxy-3-oxopropionate reductase
MTIGFIGLGAIGTPIATRLLASDEPFVMFDVRKEALAAFDGVAALASSAREVADRAEIVFGCLAAPDAHRQALLDAHEGAIAGTAMRTYVNLGTVGPVLIREIARALAARDISALDAPVTGGVGRAADGTLTAIVSGDDRAFARVEPLMRLYASKIVRFGCDPGSAQVMKLVNNAVSLGNLAVACEAMVAGAKAGLDADAMLEVLNHGSGQNSATTSKIPRDVLTGNFDFGGSLAIVRKDLAAFIDEAERIGTPSTIARTVMSAYLAAVGVATEAGDVTEVVRPMESAAGIRLRTNKDKTT